MSAARQESTGNAGEAKRGAEARSRDRSRTKGAGRVEAAVWTERMVSALDNGVKGGRWYSLQRWTNAFFAQAGLFALHTAWLAARHSR